MADCCTCAGAVVCVLPLACVVLVCTCVCEPSVLSCCCADWWRPEPILTMLSLCMGWYSLHPAAAASPMAAGVSHTVLMESWIAVCPVFLKHRYSLIHSGFPWSTTGYFFTLFPLFAQNDWDWHGNFFSLFGIPWKLLLREGMAERQFPWWHTHTELFLLWKSPLVSMSLVTWDYFSSEMLWFQLVTWNFLSPLNFCGFSMNLNFTCDYFFSERLWFHWAWLLSLVVWVCSLLKCCGFNELGYGGLFLLYFFS